MKENILINFGKKIRFYREQKGWSQEELSFRADFDRTYISLIERGKRNLSLINIVRFADILGVSTHHLLDNKVSVGHTLSNYQIIDEDVNLVFDTSFGISTTISKRALLEAIHYTHQLIDKFTDFDVDVFGLLGMRNLSGFIGELFAAGLAKKSSDLLIKNPHQDGYPDLLILDKTGLALWAELQTRLKEKAPFSPFANGGIEIKATCGSVPTPAICQKRGLQKPDIGDTRIEVLQGYDWKAHHRNTNNLVGLLWDFIAGIPRIVAVFFCSDLTNEDWGKIVQPKEGGGNTTSVSIMTRLGVYKMYQGTICVLDDHRYSAFLNKYNKDNLL